MSEYAFKKTAIIDLKIVKKNIGLELAEINKLRIDLIRLEKSLNANQSLKKYLEELVGGNDE